MAQPILSFQTKEDLPKTTANLLPCRVHYNGTVDETSPYWKPCKGENGVKVAYFRGRKLHGQTVELPDHYHGVVAKRLPDDKPANTAEIDPLHQELDEDEKTSTMQVTSKFDEFIVWGHEALANAEEDPYIRSMDEWLQVAEKIHSYPEQDTQTKN